jgi:hypothetical protein
MKKKKSAPNSRKTPDRSSDITSPTLGPMAEEARKLLAAALLQVGD